jgi:hypothetical protein
VFTALCDGQRPPAKALFALATAVTGVIIKDAMNPEGVTRKMLRMAGERFMARLEEPKAGEIRRVRTVEAEVLPKAEKPT